MEWTLTARRELAGLTLRQLANKAGVAPSYISALETGKKTNPSIRVCVAIAKALDLTVDSVAMFFVQEGKR